MSAPFHNVSCSSLRSFPLHAARVRGAFPGGLLCRSACQGEWPLTAPRFACALADRRASERAQGSERSAASGAAATRSAKLGVRRERQHERPVSQCFLRPHAPLPAPRCASPSPGRPYAWRCCSSLVWPPPNGAPHASPCIRIALRRNHVGLDQRFPSSCLSR